MSLTFSGRSSILHANFYPPILLKPDTEYVIGLIDFQSFNSIPNIETGKNDKFYYGTSFLEIPEGAYELSEVLEYIENNLPSSVLFEWNLNHTTQKCIIKCTSPIDFTFKDSIRDLLGFQSRVLPANKLVQSDHSVDISKVNAICVVCDIVSNSYSNGQQSHILHQFYPSVPAGFKIIETPRNIVYLPVANDRSIPRITLQIVDQNGELINFKQELITIRLHLKEL